MQIGYVSLKGIKMGDSNFIVFSVEAMVPFGVKAVVKARSRTRAL